MRLREANSGRLRASIRGTIPAVVTSIFVILSSVGILALLGKILDGDTYLAGVIAMVAQWFMYLPAIAIGLWLAIRFDGEGLDRFGLTIDRQWVINFVAGVGISIVVTLVYVGYGTSRGYFEFHPNRIAHLGEIPLGILLAFLAAMWVFVFLGVVWEEIVFRSVMFQNYAEGLRSRGLSPLLALAVAALGSLLFFGLYHIPWFGPFFWYTSGVGVIFLVAYLVTGRLGLAIGVHFGRFTDELQGEEAAAIELPAILDIGGLTTVGAIEVLVVELAVSCLLILAWGYAINGSVGVASRVHEPSETAS